MLTKTSLARRSPNSLFSTQGLWPYSPCSVSTAKLKSLTYPWRRMAPWWQWCKVTNCGPNAFVWRSQPLLLGRHPAGNLLLSFAILMAGASLSKVLLVLKHMGMSIYSAHTYFVHQSKFLFPAILTYWERYRLRLVEEIKKQERVIWCGDGRFDSMGHSAKYGAYTMFCCAIAKIVHFELVQVCCHLYIYTNPMLIERPKDTTVFTIIY